jgi:hypothetical protein
MEPLYLDLSDRAQLSFRKKRFNLIFGILCTLPGIIMTILMIKDEKYDLNNFSFSFYFIAMGIVSILQGTGAINYKCFFRIDSDMIEFKWSVYSRLNAIRWENITKIDIKLTRIILTMINNSNVKLDLSWFTYHNLKLVKHTIESYAKIRGIKIIN